MSVSFVYLALRGVKTYNIHTFGLERCYSYLPSKLSKIGLQANAFFNLF